MSNLRVKWAFLVIMLLVFGYHLLPTLRYYSMPSAERDQAEALDDPRVTGIRENSMRLGLDLKGGSYLVYEVAIDKIAPENLRGDEVERAMEVIRNRVDQYGVTEPVIQKQGETRIVVQLPGLNDPARARELVGKTARLDFLLVKTRQELFQAMTRVDQAVARRSGDFQTALDSLRADGDSTAAGDSTAVDSLLAGANAFSSLFTASGGDEGIVYCPSQNFGKAKAILARVIGDPSKARPAPLAGGTLLLWGPEVYGETSGMPGRYLYAVTDRAELTGDNVAEAQVAFGLDTTNPNVAGVSLTFDKRGAAVFTRITGNNVGRQLAIVLDHTVKSAPVIRDKIRGGRASITGLDSDEEARDLQIVLRAGALPTDLVLQEERAVGSTLGRDSINRGIRASLVGLILVIFTMLIYYRLSGVLAILALFGNLFFLFSTLGMLRGTLTMPGIAGIVLTIGMAVDANVLIFERIREEIRTGKTVRGAIDAGFKSALRTILDSNITTLISAVVLFQFGTGPIKGFATTLMIGIIANVFTAVFVTRLIYDSVIANRQIKKLSI